MAKYRLKYPCDDERFEEVARISHNLRYYSKIWKEHYGCANLQSMVYWQKKMDDWLSENVDYNNPILSEETVSKQKKDQWALDIEILK